MIARNVTHIENVECMRCGETLTYPESIKRGVGPYCADQLDSFLAGGGSSSAEVSMLALVDDDDTQKWLRLFGKALRGGRRRHAQGFMTSARDAAKRANARRAAVAAGLII